MESISKPLIHAVCVTPAKAGVKFFQLVMGFCSPVTVEDKPCGNSAIQRLPGLLSSSLIMLLGLLTGCGSLTSLNSELIDQQQLLDKGKYLELQPNPYWQKQRRVDNETKDKFAEAIRALEAGELLNAENQFTQLSITQPKLSGPWVNLGIIHYRRGELEQAETDWMKAIKLNRYNFDAYTNLALLKREQGQFEKAEAIYKTALAKWPDNADMHCNLGILYDLYKGQQELALQEYLVCERLSDEPSRRLRGWIVDLERRTQALASK